MTTFILNEKTVSSQAREGETLLDFIRYEKDLPGTKIGCREGDCGACTVLEGRLEGDKIIYRSIVSCLTPIGNARGKHIVTVEGLNMEKLSPVQQAMVDHGGTQCGICTPGFVVSLTNHTLQPEISTPEAAIDSVNGNICRCTGYKSIERAAISISNLLKDKNPENPIGWLVDKQFLPEYFSGIHQRLRGLKDEQAGQIQGKMIMGGGTDLLVQQPDQIAETGLDLFFDRDDLKGIAEKDGQVLVGAAATANDIMHSHILEQYFPDIKKHFRLISSDPIRNMGTIGGNIVNASPIADLTIFFMALGSVLHIRREKGNRTLPLEEFFHDYKKYDLKPGEYIESIAFPIPQKPFGFNFEKVSKRTHLDIASVNSSCFIQTENGTISHCSLAAGGVAPVPLFLKKTAAFLKGKPLNAGSIREATGILSEEISPISDVRGSKEYKALLARQLFLAHFMEIFPGMFSIKELTS